MKYIGLDCHKQYDHATMIDTDTGEVRSKRLLFSGKQSGQKCRRPCRSASQRSCCANSDTYFAP
jgi:hypothetical protein